MTDDVVEIFSDALELEDAAARSGFLERACAGDSALREKVESLLAAHDRMGEARGFLSGPSHSPGEHPAAEESGTVGRYRILQKIGEGGWGIVYMAEQTEPVRRKVALKIIKPGMDSRQVLARFDAERQALALMDHPHIARVLDAGATDYGHPYFVMELVRGTRITDYCDAHCLPVPQRLELFIQVCEAVQHAHQKGIIHRDLKPSNILVTAENGRPLPRVIDFGVAKATADIQLTDLTLFTRYETFVGTPAYMSPEQADFTAEGVDTRTDIYALGVLLYELLTGRTPFDGQSLVSHGVDAMRRTIREQMPLKPSARLRQLPQDQSAEVAGSRHTDSPRLVSRVKGDLDWIVLKALEKDRTRRYQTASAFALDIQRFLQCEPVSARPPSRLYQFGRLVRRHRLAFGAAAAVLAALIGGLGVATVALVKEHAASSEATARAAENRRQLVKLHISTGTKLSGEGDDFMALLWFTEALRLDEADPARADAHRRRIGVALRQAPRLSRLWWHGNVVRSADFSADGRTVASTGSDGTVCLHDIASAAEVRPPLSAGGELVSVRLAFGGKRVLAHEIATRGARLWNVETGAPISLPPLATSWGALELSHDGTAFLSGIPGNALRAFHTSDGTPASPEIPLPETPEYVGFTLDGRQAIAGGQGSARLVDLTSGKILRTFPGTYGLRGISFSPDARRVALLTLREAHVWDLTTPGDQPLLTLKPGGDLFQCQFSPDGTRLGIASWSGYARVYDAATGVPVSLPMTHPNPVTGAEFNKDGSLLATASRDGTARLWHPATGEPASPPLRHAGIVFSASFSPDGRHLLTASQDWTLRLWDVTQSPAARLVIPYWGAVYCITYSSDGSRLIFGGNSHATCLCDSRTGAMIRRLGKTETVKVTRFSEDGTRVFSGTDRGLLLAWDTASGESAFPPQSFPGEITVLRSGSGNRLLVAGGDRACFIDAARGTPASPRMIHAGIVYDATLSPDGKTVATTSGTEGTLQFWNATSGTAIGTVTRHPGMVRSVNFTADGTRVLTSCAEPPEVPRTAEYRTVPGGAPSGVPMPHAGGVNMAGFSPDARLVLTASDDDSAQIFDAATGRPVTTPLTHRDDVSAAHFSPDGRYVLTVSSDRTARVWETATGEPVTPPLPHGSEVTGGAWRPDGREVATCSADGYVRVWDVSPAAGSTADLQREAELLAARRLEPGFGPVPLQITELKERWLRHQQTR